MPPDLRHDASDRAYIIPGGRLLGRFRVVYAGYNNIDETAHMIGRHRVYTVWEPRSLLHLSIIRIIIE